MSSKWIMLCHYSDQIPVLYYSVFSELFLGHSSVFTFLAIIECRIYYNRVFINRVVSNTPDCYSNSIFHLPSNLFGFRPLCIPVFGTLVVRYFYSLNITSIATWINTTYKGRIFMRLSNKTFGMVLIAPSIPR